MALGETRVVGYNPAPAGGEALLTLAAAARRQSLLNDSEQQRVIRSAIQQETGLTVRLRCITDGAAAGTDAPTDERSARYRAAQQHPLVVDLMKRFQAELIGQELVEVETWLQRLTAPPAGPTISYEELGAMEVSDE